MQKINRTKTDLKLVAALMLAASLAACGGTDSTGSVSSTSAANTATASQTVAAETSGITQTVAAQTTSDGIQFSASSFAVEQSAGVVTLTVSRVGTSLPA